MKKMLRQIIQEKKMLRQIIQEKKMLRQIIQEQTLKRVEKKNNLRARKKQNSISS